MTAREHNGTEGLRRQAQGPAQMAVLLGFWQLAAATALSLAQPLQAQAAERLVGVPDSVILAQSGTAEGTGLPPPELPAADAAPSGPEVARLKEAFQQMNVQNPVVARVNGQEIRWAEVVATADDLPAQYREQIESVFPALLDRLVDLRLLADAARAEGLDNDPAVAKRVAAFEDRVLSSSLLERHLTERVTTAALRERYDALVAARRGDREIRARHILLDSEAAAAAAIARLDQGEVFISLASELSAGPSAARGGDLGYFLPSRMAPPFADAAVALEPGDYTRVPVETEFGWHVILLVDRSADNIPSFLDMQDQLREEATKTAVDRLLLSLRHQAALEMFPEDAGGGRLEGAQ
jgi:peptidyl-prolyl cis-trans isomerase C